MARLAPCEERGAGWSIVLQRTLTPAGAGYFVGAMRRLVFVVLALLPGCGEAAPAPAVTPGPAAVGLPAPPPPPPGPSPAFAPASCGCSVAQPAMPSPAP
ncbi:MAG: hypothetical protein QM820_52165 [Minicystis sp.]